MMPGDESAGSAPIAVVGATGRQGGAVVDALLERGAAVRAIARDAGKAGDLEARGVEVAVADLDDGEALRRAFEGAAALFAMTTMTGPQGTEGEVANGRAIGDAARDAEVPRLLYSSVGGAERKTGIPHFESKRQVERYLRETGVPTAVIRPAFFMENFTSDFEPTVEDGRVLLKAPLSPGVPLQMIAVADLGEAAATALVDPAALGDGAIEIAGDELTPEAMAEAIGAERGMAASFEPLPIDSLGNEDAEAMFRWLAEPPSYEADVDGTRALVGRLTDFRAFAARHLS